MKECVNFASRDGDEWISFVVVNSLSSQKERNRWTAETNAIQEYHNRYPIPQQEILQNEDIDEDDQNPGYTNQ